MTEYNDAFKVTIEEFKELGHEYRYREQLMVQHFSLSMVAVAGILNVALREPMPGSTATLLLQIFGSLFLPLVTLHLKNLNQDRLAALKRKEALRELLHFEAIHLGVNGVNRPSAMRLIVLFSLTTSVAWLTWLAASIFNVVHAYL